MEMQTSMDITQVIRTDARPTWGCTEPGATALAVARATRELPSDSEPENVSVVVSEGIYKNGMPGGLPRTGGARGNLMAAALGVRCRGEDCELETLHHGSERDVRAAETLTVAGRVRAPLNPRRRRMDITATARGGSHRTTCTPHTAVSKVSLDGLPAPAVPVRPRIAPDGVAPAGSGETHAQVIEAVLDARPRGAILRVAGLSTLAEKAMGSFDSILSSLLRARTEQTEGRWYASKNEEDRCFA